MYLEVPRINLTLCFGLRHLELCVKHLFAQQLQYDLPHESKDWVNTLSCSVTHRNTGDHKRHGISFNVAVPRKQS